jgi:hypothetical protein
LLIENIGVKNKDTKNKKAAENTFPAALSYQTEACELQRQFDN